MHRRDPPAARIGANEEVIYAAMVTQHKSRSATVPIADFELVGLALQLLIGMAELGSPEPRQLEARFGGLGPRTSCAISQYGQQPNSRCEISITQ